MTNHKTDDATDFVGLKSVQERRRRPHNATSMRAKAIVGHPLAAFARVRLWKKLLMAGIASGAIFGVYFIQQRHSVVHHQLVRKTDEPQRLTALETQRPTELETQRQAEEPATARQAAAPENERQAQLETQRQAERKPSHERASRCSGRRGTRRLSELCFHRAFGGRGDLLASVLPLGFGGYDALCTIDGSVASDERCQTSDEARRQADRRRR